MEPGIFSTRHFSAVLFITFISLFLAVSNLLEVRCIAPQWLKNHVEEFLGKIVLAKIKSFCMTSNHSAAFIASKLLMQACHLWSKEVTTWSEKQQQNGHPNSSSEVEEMIMGLVRMTVGKVR